MWLRLCPNPAIFRKQIWVLEAVVGTHTGSWVCGTRCSWARPWAWVLSGASWWDSLWCQGHSGAAGVRLGGCERCCRGVNKRSARFWEEIRTAHPPSINRTPQVSIWASHRTTSAVVLSPPSLLLVGIWWCICLLCSVVLDPQQDLQIPIIIRHHYHYYCIVEVVVVVVVVVLFSFFKNGKYM